MTRPKGELLYGILFLSGFTGLGYELVWIRMLSLGLGQEIIAALSVTAAFFFGLALGGLVTDKLVSTSERPAIWYAAFEVTIGLSALGLMVLLPRFNAWIPGVMGADPSEVRRWSVAFLIPAVVLLPATFAMGGTLNALDRVFVRLRRTGRSIGAVYSINTLGAVGGTLISVFVILPRLGFQRTLLGFAVINFFCGTLLLFLSRTLEKTHEVAASRIADSRPGDLSPRRALAILFFSGFAAIAYEVAIIRGLAQVLTGTVYSVAGVLSVYLVGNALGAAMYERLSKRAPFSRLDFLLVLQSSASCVGVVLLYVARPLHRLLGAFAASQVGNTAADLAVAALVLMIPTMSMGLLFTHLADRARGPNGGLGAALGFNTLGGAVAPFVTGLLLLPLLGLKTVLLLISLSYLLMNQKLFTKRGRWAALPACFAAAVFLWGGDLRFFSLASGERIAAHVEGVGADVTVIEDAGGETYLTIDSRFQMGGTRSTFTDRRQAHVPLLLHPNPRSSLFLGVGTAGTFAAAGLYPEMEARGIELVPELIPLLSYFEKSTGKLREYKNLKITAADAMRYVAATEDSYDVVIADLFHPGRDGAANLYTEEHFSRVRDRLNEDGLFCQWLPLYQLDLDTFRTIARTFLKVFPNARLVLDHFGIETPVLGLIGGRDDIRYSADWFETRVRRLPADELRRMRFASGYDLFGLYVAGSSELRRFAGQGPINTADFPVVMFHPPVVSGVSSSAPSDRLIALLNELHLDPAELIAFDKNNRESISAKRLAAYWRARNGFIDTGRRIPKTRDPGLLLQYAEAPLLDAVRESPDFSPAYNPLLAAARALIPRAPEAARQLLLELNAANPERVEAGRLLASVDW